MKRLVEKTYESQKKIVKKNVLLFVGNSGTGKSINLLRLLGKTMRKAFFKELPTLSPVEAVSKDHKSFHTSLKLLDTLYFMVLKV